MSDLTCRDGEVDFFSRVSWLESDSGSPDADNPAASSTGLSARGKIEFIRQGAAVPPGSRLLALHCPCGNCGNEPHALCLLSNRGVGVRLRGEDDRFVNIGILPAAIGEIFGAFPYGDVVTIVGSDGLSWLLYDGEENCYRLLTSLPDAPSVNYSATAAQLDGYTRMAGNYPEMDVEVDLSRIADLTSADALSRWLDGGDISSMERSVTEMVYRSVGERVARYCAEARDAGMWLTPFRCVSAWGEALPSQPAIVDTGYQPPFARLVSWTFRGATLALHLEFSLRPHTVTATWQSTDQQRQWSQIFPRLRVYSSEEVSWMVPGAGAAGSSDSDIRVTGFTSLSGGEGRAFRFASRPRTKVMALAREMSALRMSMDLAVSGTTGGISILGHPSASEPEYRPDYADFLPVTPDGASLSDEGVVIWSGRTLLLAMKENGVVYRYRNVICDSDLLFAAQANLNKSGIPSGRHALTIFCADGIRRVVSDGSGGYRNSRLISSTPSCGRAYAITPGGIVFITRRGVELAVQGGNVKLLTDRFPLRESGGEIPPEDIWCIHYDHRSGNILASTDEGMYVFDMTDKIWIVVSESPLTASMSLIGRNGLLYTIDNGSELVAIEMNVIKVDLSSVSASVVDAGGEKPWGQSPTADAEYDIRSIPAGKCMVRTRPLKLGDPFVRKKICGVYTVGAGEVSIEGSNDFAVWHKICKVPVPARGLHSEAFRFHRLTLLLPEEMSDTIGRIGVVIQDL